MNFSIVEGDLLEQKVQVIVNAWNRNIIPWWLLLPKGVSGAIKKRGGLRPFREVARFGPIPLGQARLTGAGNLPFTAIIHVAGIDMLWRASEASIRGSVRAAMQIVQEQKFASVAFPIIGAGSGGFNEERALQIMHDEFAILDQSTLNGVRVLIVKFRATC
ncbi:MAG: O-acetyl-ADP-ribose deacetylase [Abditibacteriota bacterium]|nr:O-acetyl-ADP-ribose deacetylase [Abditibacteriota bacterium]